MEASWKPHICPRVRDKIHWHFKEITDLLICIPTTTWSHFLWEIEREWELGTNKRNTQTCMYEMHRTVCVSLFKNMNSSLKSWITRGWGLNYDTLSEKWRSTILALANNSVTVSSKIPIKKPFFLGNVKAKQRIIHIWMTIFMEGYWALLSENLCYCGGNCESD